MQARRVRGLVHEGCDGEVTIVRRFGAAGCDVGFDRLPGLVPVVGALVHVRARKVLRCKIDVPVHTPQGSTEAVAQARSSLSGERVVLAHDEWDVWVERFSQLVDTS